MEGTDWAKNHVLKIGNEPSTYDEVNEAGIQSLREKIEPWLSAIFQSEHLSLLAGTGLTAAVTQIAGTCAQDMNRIEFDECGSEIKEAANTQAKNMARGIANFEDDLRVAIQLCAGLAIQGDGKAKTLNIEINKKLREFINNVLETEREFLASDKASMALSYLKSFLISFASRTASRDRLQIFTTNYDRYIEYACDMTGILILDRFVGKISPIFRKNKLELDYHYNPPGIRGEPRYVEGVIKFTKLHGSLDWQFKENEIIKASLPFGAIDSHPELVEEPFDHIVIYPNSDKAVETTFYPYSELFRDFSNAVCRPNCAVVTYGYGFGDSHVNNTLKEMLTVPSTHLVIISWDGANGRIEKFVEDINHSQLTLLIGSHFGDLKILVENYLPKAAIDRISERKLRLLEKRTGGSSGKPSFSDSV